VKGSSLYADRPRALWQCNIAETKQSRMPLIFWRNCVTTLQDTKECSIDEFIEDAEEALQQLLHQASFPWQEGNECSGEWATMANLIASLASCSLLDQVRRPHAAASPPAPVDLNRDPRKARAYGALFAANTQT
jgi:hypothetical protein